MAHKVIQANCVDYMAKAPADSFDFIFADPPYLLSNGGFSVSSGRQVSVNKGKWDKSSGQVNDFNFHLQWISQCQRLLKPNGTIAISGTRHSIYKCAIALEQLGFKVLNEIVWFKPNGAPNIGRRNFAESHEIVLWAAKNEKSKHVFNYLDMKHYESSNDYIKKTGKQMRDVWVIPNTPHREKTHGKHPTQKPLQLLLRIISAATNPGDKILDPFCGSGTTGVAAKMLGRNFVGIDSSASYVALAESRIKATKKVAARD